MKNLYSKNNLNHSHNKGIIIIQIQNNIKIIIIQAVDRILARINKICHKVGKTHRISRNNPINRSIIIKAKNNIISQLFNSQSSRNNNRNKMLNKIPRQAIVKAKVRNSIPPLIPILRKEKTKTPINKHQKRVKVISNNSTLHKIIAPNCKILHNCQIMHHNNQLL